MKNLGGNEMINYDELVNFEDVDVEEDTSNIDEILEYEEILFEISNCLKNYRKIHNLTQKELAEKLGINQVMISKLERGNYNPTFKQLHKISRKLTNSSELFINVLENIINNISEMYKTTYDLKLKTEEYSVGKKNIIYMKDMKDYILDVKGGEYGGEKCTSNISIAG